MTYNEFLKSLEGNSPTPGLSAELTALWYDAKEDWHTAHSKVDSLDTPGACWVHAYLHRKEGDAWNAGYWYRRANKKHASVSLAEEWETLVKALL